MFLSAALWRIAVGAGQVAPQELLVVDPVDGSDLLFELLGTVVHDPREGTGIVSVLRNVTDLRRATEELSENYRRIRLAEAEVRSERDRLDVIIDSVADPILVSDDAGKVTLMNAPAERLFTGALDGDEAGQRHLRANDAHFSSFISGLLSDGHRNPAPRRDLVDRGRHWCAAAVRGDRRQGAVRGRRAHRGRHDPPRSIRGARAGAALRTGQAGLERARSEGGGGHDRAGAAEQAASPPGGRARTGVGAEVAVPGEHVARVPDAAQRDPGLCEHPAPGHLRRAEARPAQGARPDRVQRPASRRHHQ